MAKLIIFGNRQFAQLAKYRFENDTTYEVVAFTVDKEYITQETFEGLPVLAFENIEEIYSPLEYQMFIAIGYTEMNRLRERKFYEAKRKGYQLATYISSRTNYLSQYKCGENCFIFENNTIEDYAKIEDNVIIWSGNLIAHHSIIHCHNYISCQVVVAGNCEVESNCFLGVNSAIADGVRIARGTLVGAGAVITKDTEPDSVYVPPRSIKLDKKSWQIEL